jgi:hypothetical protein
MTIYHKHHIIPKHAGGTDEPENLIILTIEEHAEAHRILFELYGRKEDEIAWKALSGQIKISEAKKQAQKLGAIKGGKITGPRPKKISEQGRKNMSAGQKGKIITQQHKKNVVDQVSRWWEFISPDGKIFIEKNKNEFCKLHNLTPNSMSLVAQGKQSHHKGWKCRKLGKELFLVKDKDRLILKP